MCAEVGAICVRQGNRHIHSNAPIRRDLIGAGVHIQIRGIPPERGQEQLHIGRGDHAVGIQVAEIVRIAGQRAGCIVGHLQQNLGIQLIHFPVPV